MTQTLRPPEPAAPQSIDPHAPAVPAPRARRGVAEDGTPGIVPDREGWLDLTFTAVLVALALVGFHTGYYGGAWMVAAGAGLLLGLCVGWVSVAYRWAAVSTLAALAGAYFLFGGPFAVREDLVGGVIPTPTTLLDLATTVTEGWKRWLTMLPPVDAAGPLLALPFLFALIGAAVLLILARRRPGTLFVVVPAVGLLALSIVLGTLAPASLLLQGLVFSAVLIGWLILRARRSRAPLQGGSGQRARLITAALLILISLGAGYLVAPHLPGADPAEPRHVARTALEPPFDVAQFPSPLAGFRRYTEPNPADLYEREILHVSGLPAGQPLRLATLDAYDGITWRAANRADTGESDPGQAFQQIGSRVATTFPGTAATVRVSVPEGGYRGVWVPSAGAVAGVSFEGPRARTLSERSWLNIDSGSVIVPDRLQPGDSYAMEVVLPETPPGELPESVTLASGALTITTDTSYLDRRVDQWGGREDSAWGRLRAVMGAMASEGAYTDGGTENSHEKVYLPGHSTARLGRFMASEQLAGNDEQYAATLALIANRLGVPARVVMGAVPTDAGVVHGKDVHAWVEVKQSNGTWLTILPQHFVPDRNQEPNEQQRRTEEQRVGALVPPPAGVNPPSMLQGPEQAQNATDIRKKQDNPLDLSTWPTWLLWLVLGVVLPLLLLLMTYALIRFAKTRRRRRHARTGPPAERVAWIWRDLVADARAYRVAVPTGATRLEQAAAIDAALGAAAPATDLAREAAVLANAGVFGPADPEAEQAQALFAQTTEVRAALRSRATRRERVRADLDLRPLFARSRPRRSGRTGSGRPTLRWRTS